MMTTSGEDTKTCRVCGITQPIQNFNMHARMRDARKNECKSCCNKYNRNREHTLGLRGDYRKSRNCSQFLGIHVAERLLESVFSSVLKMPNNNPGYDFICGKGYKVDVKSSCLLDNPECSNKHWMFTIKRNRTPDYFAFIALDNRNDLTPLHFWIVPESAVGNRVGVAIQNSDRVLLKWKIYEKPIDKLVEGCSVLKGVK